MTRCSIVASLAVASTLVACGAEAPAENADVVESAAKRELRSPGVYDVPVEPALAHAASNPVTVKLRDLGDGRVRLKYDLPAVIAGFDREVDLFGEPDANGDLQLAGPSGTGSCTESPTGEIVCVEHLDGVAMSLSEATAAIDAKGLTEAERAARRAVAERFIIDPLGVVRFQRTARSR